MPASRAYATLASVVSVKRRAVALAYATASAALLLIGSACSAGGGQSATAGPREARSPARTTPSSASEPTPPPSGRLTGDLRQSSRDAALGRMQVWITNDTAQDATPVRIRFIDSRFAAPLPAERLRAIPSGSFRGYPIAYPDALPCSQRSHDPGMRRVIEVRLAGESRVRRFAVADPNRLVAAYAARRCAEVAVERVAGLAWSSDIQARPDGSASMALMLTPAGGKGRLTIVQVHGTPLLTPADGTVWRPGATVRGTDPEAVAVALAVRPSRCDPHVFMESTGATAFAVDYRLDGEPGSLVVRMGGEAARNLLAYAVQMCGLD